MTELLLPFFSELPYPFPINTTKLKTANLNKFGAEPYTFNYLYTIILF